RRHTRSYGDWSSDVCSSDLSAKHRSLPRILTAGGSGASHWKYLSARRLALFVAASIEQGTRWVLLEHNGPATWERARAQVAGFQIGRASCRERVRTAVGAGC